MKDFLITLYIRTFTGEMKEDNDSEQDIYIVMRIKDEKQESEDIAGKNDENTGIGQSRMNTESRSIAIDQTNDVL